MSSPKDMIELGIMTDATIITAYSWVFTGNEPGGRISMWEHHGLLHIADASDYDKRLPPIKFCDVPAHGFYKALGKALRMDVPQDSKWIPVEERLPELHEERWRLLESNELISKPVFVFCRRPEVAPFVVFYWSSSRDVTRWIDCHTYLPRPDVTHWMPLPEPPEGA